MSELICVSNRVMAPGETHTSGGLAVALGELLQARGGSWTGWSGRVSETPQIDVQRGRFTAVMLDKTSEEHQSAYVGYSNSVLWPVFHNRLDLARFDRDFFGSYAAFNSRVADAIASMAKPGDSIWVHDYHFLLLGEFLRARGLSNPIGFFLHIPMPPPEAFLAIPEYRTLATALGAYDLVGLQTTHDVGNVISCLRAAAGAELVPSGRLAIDGSQIRVGSFPITIDGDCRRSFAASRIC